MAECYIIAGSNGSGKTTFAREFLPGYVHCLNFINPDLVAAGLSPFAPERAMLKAGRLVLQEIEENIRARKDFAFETTLSGRAYLHLISKIKEAGYRVHMFYLWIPSPELAIQRIRIRVEEGGHHVAENDVRRRYKRTLGNLFNHYRTLLDSLHFFDSSTSSPTLIFRDVLGRTTVFNQTLYQAITSTSGVAP